MQIDNRKRRRGGYRGMNHANRVDNDQPCTRRTPIRRDRHTNDATATITPTPTTLVMITRPTRKIKRNYRRSCYRAVNDSMSTVSGWWRMIRLATFWIALPAFLSRHHSECYQVQGVATLANNATITRYSDTTTNKIDWSLASSSERSPQTSTSNTRPQRRQSSRSSSTPMLWMMDLHPTTTLGVDPHRYLMDFETINGTAFQQRSAVYASVPDPHDGMHRPHTFDLHDFFTTRHKSRYEQQRQRNQEEEDVMDVDGIYYRFDLQDEEESTAEPTEKEENASSWWSVVMARTRRRLSSHTRTTTTTTTTTTLTTSTTPSTSSSSTVGGGQFDNYQAVPLSQGYGTHFANVWVGSPTPQRKTVIVDTGSHYTAFPCAGCENCGGLHHTDPYFQPSQSDTFHTLLCDECRDGVACDNGRCKFSQSYTEGSSWEAVQVQDRFYCGGTDILDSVEPSDQKYTIDFMFGCQVSMTGLFITQLADGIMGMSAHPATLPKQLYDKRIIEHNMFAMCFRRELGTSKRGVTAGSMTLGGYSSTLDTSPVVYAKNMASLGWFTVYVKNIYVRTGGGQSAFNRDKSRRTIRVRVDPAKLNSGKGVIVDSGTTDTYLNKAVGKEFSRAWKAATGKVYSHAPIRLTAEQLRTLPTILIQAHSFTQKVDPSIDDYNSIPGYTGNLDPSSPNDLLIAIPATSYMDYSPITKLYTSRVYFTETTGGVLGSNAMQGHNVVFDWGNGRIGFAESSCTYDKKNVPEAALDSGYSADCIVANPILSQACIDTVDRRLCQHNPTNIALLGTETWTATVESAGTDTGSTCVESTKGWRSSNVLNEPVIKCEGDGTCEERRPCQLTCSEAKKAAEIRPTPSENAKLECGDSHWSACDYGCSQTRIASEAHSDGFCHEVSRSTRPCHIGACARSDPCRVPFLIHVVVGLRDEQVENWTITAEEQFVSALTKASASLSNKRHFDEGDVNVLGVLPWFEEDDEEVVPVQIDAFSKQEDEPETPTIGLKVVFEISVFNPLARVESKSEAQGAETNDYGVTSFLRNVSLPFGEKKTETTCNREDLFILAKKALAIKKDTFQHRKFSSAFEGALAALVETGQANLLNKNMNQDAPRSHVLAAWSIQTEVDDEINYFGPPKPFWFRLLAVTHTAVLVVVVFMLLTTAWAVISAACETFSEEAGGVFVTVRNRLVGFSLKGRSRYSAVNLTDDDAEIEDAIMGLTTVHGGSNLSDTSIELTVQSSPQRYNRTTPIKRRTTLSSRTSSDLTDR